MTPPPSSQAKALRAGGTLLCIGAMRGRRWESRAWECCVRTDWHHAKQGRRREEAMARTAYPWDNPQRKHVAAAEQQSQVGAASDIPAPEEARSAPGARKRGGRARVSEKIGHHVDEDELLRRFAAGEALVAMTAFDGLDLTDVSAGAATFEQVVFRSCAFDGVDFSRCTFTDVVFSGCGSRGAGSSAAGSTGAISAHARRPASAFSRAASPPLRSQTASCATPTSRRPP